MKFDILTLFPEMFTGPFNQSIIKRAQDQSLIRINLHDLREWSVDKHGSVDDRPYGGGVGMIIRVEPIFNALKELRNGKLNTKVILMDPRGTKFTQKKARELSKLNQLIIISGRYEGVDERVRENLVDEAISIGDYVLTGGEIPSMVIVDSVSRLIPGVLEKPEATLLESFSDQSSILNPLPSNFEHPQYTRPEEFNGWKVPQVLLSGNHKEIENWRKSHSVGEIP